MGFKVKDCFKWNKIRELEFMDFTMGLFLALFMIITCTAFIGLVIMLIFRCD